MERSNTEWFFLFRTTQIFNRMAIDRPVACTGLVWMLGMILKDSVDPAEGYAAKGFYRNPEQVIRDHFPQMLQGIEDSHYEFSNTHLAVHDEERSEDYKKLVLLALTGLGSDLETYLGGE